MKTCLTIVKMIVVFLCSSLFAATYHVSTSGSDGANGTSTATPWATISKVNNTSFAAGDSILFQGGQTFSGAVNLGSDDRASSTARIVVSSYGTGVATISAGSGSGIIITSTPYIMVSRLKITGAGVESSSSGTGGIRGTGSNFLSADSVEASGFKEGGIYLSNCTDARITRCYLHHNGRAGFNAKQNVARLYIGYTRANYNTGYSTSSDISGSGIEIYYGNNSTIEYCECGYNGGNQNPGVPNGPVGLWWAYSSGVTCQYNIVHDNTNNTGDGGGIDIDSDSPNNLVQYNYCYRNKGYGLQFWQYDCNGTIFIENNIVRYNIFEENEQHGVWGGGGCTSHGIRNNQVYNNLIIRNKQYAVAWGGSSVTSGMVLKNNIIWPTFGSQTINQFVTTSNTTFQGNCYYSTDGTFSMWGNSSLTAMANATGQEKVNGTIVGISGDPRLASFTNDQRPTDPTKLKDFEGYKLLPGSPCIDAGVSVTSPGSTDLWGNAIPVNGTLDIGPYEYSMYHTDANGITYSALTYDPLQISNTTATPVTFTIHASQSSGSITGVSLNLSTIGGGSAVNMTAGSGDVFTTTYTVPKDAAAGDKIISATISDNASNQHTVTAIVPIRGTTGYYPIYTDATNIVTSTWVGDGAGNVSTFTEATSGAAEGSKCYYLKFTMGGYWAGCGMMIPTTDFSQYDSLVFSYKGPGNGLQVQVGLAFADNTDTGNSGYPIPNVTNWTNIAIPLSSFSSYSLSTTKQLNLIVIGAQTGSGNFYIDDVKLATTGVSAPVMRMPQWETAMNKSAQIQVSGRTILLTKASNCTVRIYNLSGILLKDMMVHSGENGFAWKAPVTGLYVVKYQGPALHGQQVVALK